MLDCGVMSSVVNVDESALYIRELLQCNLQRLANVVSDVKRHVLRQDDVHLSGSADRGKEPRMHSDAY